MKIAPPEPVAGGCSTIGKLPLRAPGRATPNRARTARGSTFIDESNVTWLDFDMALGSVVWGHGRREFADAISTAYRTCGAPSVPSLLERKAALALLRRLPQFEQLRFFKTGADACSASVRIARAATRRPLIAIDGYHGWHDWSVARAYSDDPRTLGVLPSVKRNVLKLNPQAPAAALSTLRAAAGDLAGVIVRPEAWSRSTLARFRAICRSQRAILIFDEVTSHFKYGKTGRAGALGLWPDMLCISKGLANGLPLAATLGSEALMRYAVVARISSTYASESTALAALIVGDALLGDARQWPSWREALADVIAAVRRAIRRQKLTGIEIVGHPGFFSLERAGIPFRTDPFRQHLVACLADDLLFTRGWFHGSDQHTEADWRRLRRGLESALASWAALEAAQPRRNKS